MTYSAQLEGTNSTAYAARLASWLGVPARDIQVDLVVELALVVAGSVEAFDEIKDSFKDGLAASLGVNASALNLAVTSASLRVVASIDVDEDGAASVISALASRTSNITALGNLLGVVVESANETVWTIATVRAPSPARAAEIASELNDATKASESLGVTVLEAQEPAVAVSLVAAPSPPPPSPPSPPLPPPPSPPSPPSPPAPPSPPPGACVTGGPDRFKNAVASAASPIAPLEPLEPEPPVLAASFFIMIASLAFALAVTFFQKPQRFLGLCGAARARSPAPEATDKVEQRSLGTRAAQKAEQGRLRASVLGQRLGLNSMHVNQVGTAEMFYGINGARMVASMHIVMGHLYQMNALPGSIYLFSWGFTWVP